MTYVTASRFRARAVDHLAVAIGTTKGLFLVIDSAVDGPLLAGEGVLAFAQLPDVFSPPPPARASAPISE